MNSLNDIFGLNGKHALITGGGGLLGKKHAEAILMAGGRPVLADIHAESLQSVASELSDRFQIDIATIGLDIASEQSVSAAFKELVGRDVEIDILINNAARNPKVSSNNTLENFSRLESLDMNEFIDDMKVNISGAVLCTKYFGAAMARRGNGVIVNIASDLGVIAPDQRLYAKEGVSKFEQEVKPVSYSVAKHGIIGFTKYLATYWADCGVRSNCISPGGVYAGQSDIFLSRIQKLIPLGRMANPDEYQGAIIFLCSAASSYMNGANLIIDGGRSVW